jgi:hypothetical protein
MRRQLVLANKRRPIEPQPLPKEIKNLAGVSPHHKTVAFREAMPASDFLSIIAGQRTF